MARRRFEFRLMEKNPSKSPARRYGEDEIKAAPTILVGIAAVAVIAASIAIASCAKPDARAQRYLDRMNKEQRDQRAGQLFDAIDSDNTAQVRMILANDSERLTDCALKQGMVSWFYDELDGYTPLLYAVIAEKAEMVDILLASGANVNGRGPGGITPITLAAEHGNLELTEKLIKKGGDISLKTNSGMQALGLVVEDKRSESKEFEIVQLLMANGADVNERQEGGYSILMLAIEDNDFGIASIMLDAGADPNVIALDGMSAMTLIASVYPVDEESLMRLLNHGAKLNLANEDGLTPLAEAVRKDREWLAERLIERGAKVNVEYYDRDNGIRETPLIQMALTSNTEMIRLLARNGADLNYFTEEGISPLIAAAYHGDYVTNELLLDLGAKINRKNAAGETALLYAAVANQPVIADILVKRGATVNYTTKSGLTPLIAAAKHEGGSTLKVLVSAGAKNDENASRDGELGTPLPYTGPMYTFEQVLEHLRKYDTER